MKPYLYERQTEYWTSRAIETYFLDAGFQIATFPISQLHERHLPVDFVFDHPGVTKLFGLQYKTLYHDKDDGWKLAPHQHQKLQLYDDWTYYCFSELRTTSEVRNALYRAFLKTVNFTFAPWIAHSHIRNILGGYYRWPGFVAMLEGCRLGIQVDSAEAIGQAVRREDRAFVQELDQNLVDVFAINLDAHRILHFSPAGWAAEPEG